MSQQLFDARKAALDRGDDALAREIYHQLVGMGYRPENIDAGNLGSTIAEDAAALRAERAQEPAVEEPVAPEPAETTEAPAPPEKAVKPAPKRRSAKAD